MMILIGELSIDIVAEIYKKSDLHTQFNSHADWYADHEGCVGICMCAMFFHLHNWLVVSTAPGEDGLITSLTDEYLERVTTTNQTAACHCLLCVGTMPN